VSATLIEQVTSGANGTRIYFCNGQYYLVDGVFDCTQPGELLEHKSWASFSTLDEAQEILDDRFN